MFLSLFTAKNDYLSICQISPALTATMGFATVVGDPNEPEHEKQDNHKSVLR